MGSSEAVGMKISNITPLTMLSQQLQQHPPPPSSSTTETTAPPAKKKRNLPGTPDPDAEVIALSPRTLLATNRFVCEICSKGFQRDQNLQLHRRGHNLPWKLRQRSGKEPPRKRVYVCPEKSCVHHNPARALGDLTGIKKHFCRKHGEKKWKCEKCSKKYAVQSDWKAHSKTCGTREYRCDCGTLFSRRDSFITHRAFCDALAHETARLSSSQHYLNSINIPAAASNNNNIGVFTEPPSVVAPPPPPPMLLPLPLPLPTWHSSTTATAIASGQQQLGMGMAWLYGHGDNNNNKQLSSINSNSNSNSKEAPSLFSSQHQHQHAKSPDMSATALLQKAAQIGAVTTTMPLQVACGFDEPPPPPPDKQSAAGLFFAAGSQQNTNVPATFDDVLSAVRHAVGREETRDFLGVGVQALCPPSLPLHGWI